MERKWIVNLALGLTLFMGACSSSPTSSEPQLDENGNPIAEAGTDTVPQENADGAAPVEGDPNAQAVTDPNADPNAVPPDEQQVATAPADGGDPAQAAAATDPNDASAEAKTAEEVAQAEIPIATPETKVDQPAESQEMAEADVQDSDPAPQPSIPRTKKKKSHSRKSWDGETESYTVKHGDTLMKIAFETYGDLYRWREIYEANRSKIRNPNAVPPGTVLDLEVPSVPVKIARNGERYLIKWGDTLGTISDDVYGTKSKWKRIWKNNPQLIKNPDRIFAGFYLYYTFTEQDRMDKEQFRGTDHGPKIVPQPLVQQNAPTSLPPAQFNSASNSVQQRAPASVTQ